MTTIIVISRSSKRLLTRRSVVSFQINHHSLWTSDGVVKSPHKSLDLPNILVPEQIWKNLDKWANKTALVCGVTNRSYTYHQTYKYSLSFAAALRSKFGINDGDVVCIMMPNLPEYGIVVLGILQAGAEVTTVNPIYTYHEVSRQLSLSNPKIIIGVPETINNLKEAMKVTKTNVPIITVKDANDIMPAGTVSFEELTLDNHIDHSVLKEVNKKPDDIAFLPYSSGTTGLPKGVELTNRNIVANLVQMDTDGVKHYTETTSTSQEAAIGVLPFFHIYGLTIVLLHKLSVGLKLVTLPKFQPNTFLKAMEDHKINLLNAAPPLILFCATHKSVKKDHMKHVNIITTGAAPFPIQDFYKVCERCSPKMKFVQLYGLTETSPLATSMVPGENNISTAGYALSNTELKIVNCNMESLGPNEVGELLIKGPQVMKGYRNNVEATKSAITEDNWFKTGDMARIDQTGAVTIVDRLKELIKVKGYQVAPAELESVLKEHPGILDAAVVGITDEKQGEAPKAFVVVKEGCNLKIDDVTKFVEERVAPYKRVKEVMFLESIPKNPSGKILRRVLREKYC